LSGDFARGEADVDLVVAMPMRCTGAGSRGQPRSKPRWTRGPRDSAALEALVKVQGGSQGTVCVRVGGGGEIRLQFPIPSKFFWASAKQERKDQRGSNREERTQSPKKTSEMSDRSPERKADRLLNQS